MGELSRACLSVLQTTKATLWIPSLYMWFTAFPPPPPTPITLIIVGSLLGTLKFNKLVFSSSILIDSFILQIVSGVTAPKGVSQLLKQPFRQLYQPNSLMQCPSPCPYPSLKKHRSRQ